jgi:hypothetical protein
MVTRLQVKVKTFLKEMQEMTENSSENVANSGKADSKLTRGNIMLRALGVLVSLEAVLVTTGAIYFLSRIFLEATSSLSGAVVIFVITLVIALGLVVTAVSTFRKSSWTRGAIVTWQILQFAVATSFIQGIAEWQPLGWLMILLSAAALLLVFNPQVTLAMRRDDE